MGTDSYPKTMQGTVKMMTLFEEKGIVGTGGSGGESGGTVEGGVAFTQTGKPVNGPDSAVKCFSCRGNHYASRCPETTQQQKDELYSEEAKAKRAALRTKKGVNQLTPEGSGNSSKESTKAAAAAKSTSGASSAALMGALGSFSKECGHLSSRELVAFQECRGYGFHEVLVVAKLSSGLPTGGSLGHTRGRSLVPSHVVHHQAAGFKPCQRFELFSCHGLPFPDTCPE